MAKAKIAVLGSGTVGEVLADGFLKHGYEVMRGSREPAKLNEWKQKAGSKAKIGNFQEAAAFGSIIVLAVKGTAAAAALELCGAPQLKSKIIIDATNPIAEKPPVNGVLSFFTSLEDSLMEQLQRKFPHAHFVKSFSCVGNAFMVNPQFKEGKPSMFICGNQAEAKQTVRQILSEFGWDTEDMGGVEAARAIEPLCILWCIPGFLHNQWNHAFRLMRA